MKIICIRREREGEYNLQSLGHIRPSRQPKVGRKCVKGRCMAWIIWGEWQRALLIAREGAKMVLQLSNGLWLSPDQLVHPPLFFILPGFPYDMFLLALNLPPLLLLLAVHKPSKIGDSLINRVHASREMMEIMVHTSKALLKTRNLHLKGGEGLKESGVNLHAGRRGRRPSSLMGEGWWNGSGRGGGGRASSLVWVSQGSGPSCPSSTSSSSSSSLSSLSSPSS